MTDEPLITDEPIKTDEPLITDEPFEVAQAHLHNDSHNTQLI